MFLAMFWLLFYFSYFPDFDFWQRTFWSVTFPFSLEILFLSIRFSISMGLFSRIKCERSGETLSTLEFTPVIQLFGYAASVTQEHLCKYVAGRGDKHPKWYIHLPSTEHSCLWKRQARGTTKGLPSCTLLECHTWGAESLTRRSEPQILQREIINYLAEQKEALLLYSFWPGRHKSWRDKSFPRDSMLSVWPETMGWNPNSKNQGNTEF